jgi:DNA-binding GntR family transcriptional regulator
VHVDRARQIVLPQPGRVAATLQEHAAIIDAIAAGDPAAAQAATAAHLGQLVTRIERLAADTPDILAS